MCFSSKYRNSYACQLEAEYACRLEAEYAKNKLHRPKKIIPIKIERQYNPTGWLTKIVKNDNWIDFSNSDLIDRINEEYEKMAEK